MEERIEKAVRERRTGLVKKLIPQYLRAHKRSLEKRIQCADWLRRLGLYQLGYNLIAPTEWKLAPLSTETIEGKHQLWCARFLNLLGSTRFALKFLSTLTCSSAESHRIAGNIYLSAYDHLNAYHHFKKAAELEAPSTYPAKLALLGLSDCLAELEKYEEAIQVAANIPLLPEEKLLKGMVLQATGAYLAKAGRFKVAEKSLQAAKEFFPEGDSPDHGILYKWLAYTQAKLGKKQEAKINFKKALACLKKPDIRAEAWLDIYYYMNSVGLLPTQKQALLLHYPELPKSFIERSKKTKIKIVRNLNTKFWISIHRNEWRYKKSYFLNIPKEIQLLCILKKAGPQGCHLNRVKPALWPDEAGSFLQLTARIDQLILRLRKKYGIKIKIKNSAALLTEQDLKLIAVDPSEETYPTFLQHNKEFTSAQVANYYGLKKTQTSEYLKVWVNQNLISKKPGTAGANQSYLSHFFLSSKTAGDSSVGSSICKST